MIVANSNSGGDGSIRDVVFRLALIEDPNNERVAQSFANRVSGPISPGPGLNTGSTAGGGGSQGYTGRTGGGAPGTFGSTGSYAEDMKRIVEARKAGEEAIQRLRVEAERKIGEERKRALEIAAALETKLQEQLAAQKRRYDDDEQKRKEKTWRNELRWAEMVRVEREKAMRAEGRDYASRVEGGQDASYRRMQMYISRNGLNRRMSGGSFGEALEGATQIGRAGVLAANSFGMDTTEILHNVMLAEAGFSAAKGSYKLLRYGAAAGVPGAVGAYALGGKIMAGGKALAGGAWAGATSTTGASIIAPLGIGLGVNSIYEAAAGTRGGMNDYVAQNLGYNTFFDSMMRGDNDKTMRMERNLQIDMEARQREQSIRESMRQAQSRAFAVSARDLEYNSTWSGSRLNREIYGMNRSMAQAEMRGFDVSGMQNRLVQDIGLRNRQVGGAEILTLRDQQQGLQSRMAGESENTRLATLNQIMQIEERIGEIRKSQGRATMETLEQMRRAREAEADSLRMQGEDKMAAFGRLRRVDQGAIRRAEQKFEQGRRLSPTEENLLMQFAGPETAEKLRQQQIGRGRRAGGDAIFGNEFEAAAQRKDKLAEDIKKELDKVTLEVKEVGKQFGMSIKKMLEAFTAQGMKAMEENNQAKEKAKAANVPK